MNSSTCVDVLFKLFSGHDLAPRIYFIVSVSSGNTSSLKKSYLQADESEPRGRGNTLFVFFFLPVTNIKGMSGDGALTWTDYFCTDETINRKLKKMWHHHLTSTQCRDLVFFTSSFITTVYVSCAISLQKKTLSQYKNHVKSSGITKKVVFKKKKSKNALMFSEWKIKALKYCFEAILLEMESESGWICEYCLGCGVRGQRFLLWVKQFKVYGTWQLDSPNFSVQQLTPKNCSHVKS